MRNRSEGRSARSYTNRKLDTRLPQKVFLIVCEGKETEKNYFLSFQVPGNVVEVVGLGDNTLSLVERAAEMKKEGKYDHVWCVFDRDSFPPDHFNRALEAAKKNEMQVAYSNEAFELWYLLHFAYHDTAMARTAYREKLTQCLGSRYEKNRQDIFELLEDKQDNAIRNAERLLSEYAMPNPEQDNPSTTVHLLVKELNKHRRP